jgi:hypothetical protein
LLFVGSGETGEWGHAGSYPEYPNAAHRDGSFLRELWHLVRSLPDYSGKTTMTLLPGREHGMKAKWTDHGKDIPRVERVMDGLLGTGQTRPRLVTKRGCAEFQ